MTARSALKNTEFKFFLGLRFFLTIALQMQALIVGWQVYRIMEDPLALGLIGLAEAIPAISIALYAGHIADIKSKRMIMIRSVLVMLACSIGLMIVNQDDVIIGLGGSNAVRAMYFFIFLHGFARGFYAPTGFAFLSQIVKREQLTVSSTLNSSVWQIAAIIGPAAGGLIFAWLGVDFSFTVIISFTVIALFCLLMISPKPVIMPEKLEPIWARLKEGVSYVWNNKVILSALSLDLFAVLFGGAIALLPIFAEDILQVGAQGLGFLRAAPSLGASITMIIISIRKPFIYPGKVLLWTVAGFGVSILTFGLSTSFLLSLIALFLSGAFDSVSVVIRGNILQLQTPDHMRGRVSAVNSMFIGSSNEIGAFESGVAAKLLGAVGAVVFGGSVTMIVVGLAAWKAKSLSSYQYPNNK
jgi:MFS family permease